MKTLGEVLFGILSLAILAEGLGLIGVALWTHFELPFWFVVQFDVFSPIAIAYCIIWAKFTAPHENLAH